MSSPLYIEKTCLIGSETPGKVLSHLFKHSYGLLVKCPQYQLRCHCQSLATRALSLPGAPWKPGAVSHSTWRWAEGGATTQRQGKGPDRPLCHQEDEGFKFLLSEIPADKTCQELNTLPWEGPLKYSYCNPVVSTAGPRTQGPHVL